MEGGPARLCPSVSAATASVEEVVGLRQRQRQRWLPESAPHPPAVFLDEERDRRSAGRPGWRSSHRNDRQYCSCGCLVVQPETGAAERNTSSCRGRWRCGFLRRLSLQMLGSKRLVLRLPHLLVCSREQQQRRPPEETECGTSSEIVNCQEDRRAQESAHESYLADEMDETADYQGPASDGSHSGMRRRTGLPPCYPLFVTLACLGAPPIAARSPPRRLNRTLSGDWTLDTSAATAGEAVGAVAQAGGTASDEGYSDSSEDSFFVPCPRGRVEATPFGAYHYYGSRETTVVDSSGSGLIEPKWPASWGHQHGSATNLSGIDAGPSLAETSKQRGGARRRAQEKLHNIAAKLKGGAEKAVQVAGAMVGMGAPDGKQGRSQRIENSSAVTDVKVWERVESAALQDANEETLLWIMPPTQTQPALDVCFIVLEEPSAKEEDASQKELPPAATEPTPLEDESSCCSWLFRCCSAGTPDDTAHTAIVTKDIREHSTSTARKRRVREAAPARRAQEGKRAIERD